jgi:hypothetical protein
LVEENFDTLDPGCPQTKKFKRINPKKRCIHCEWTQAGTRQVFVNHILDLASTIRYLRPIIKGTAETKYMALIELVGKNAEAIVKAIIVVCQENRIDLKKLSNIASDGASVVAGKHTGVCKRLSDMFNPYITVNHCIAHRTALAGDNATETISI